MRVASVIRLAIAWPRQPGVDVPLNISATALISGKPGTSNSTLAAIATLEVSLNAGKAQQQPRYRRSDKRRQAKLISGFIWRAVRIWRTSIAPLAIRSPKSSAAAAVEHAETSTGQAHHQHHQPARVAQRPDPFKATRHVVRIRQTCSARITICCTSVTTCILMPRSTFLRVGGQARRAHWQGGQHHRIGGD